MDGLTVYNIIWCYSNLSRCFVVTVAFSTAAFNCHSWNWYLLWCQGYTVLKEFYAWLYKWILFLNCLIDLSQSLHSTWKKHGKSLLSPLPVCRIWGSHSSGQKELCLLGCYGMYFIETGFEDWLSMDCIVLCQRRQNSSLQFLVLHSEDGQTVRGEHV
jgi:hypothetical protein